MQGTKLDKLKPVYFWIAVILVLLPIFSIGQRHGLWRTTDARAIEIAREMYVSGNYAVPHFNGEAFLEKPPLFFAATALSFKIFGRVSEGVARVPAAMFALIGVIATIAVGVRLRGRAFGLIAGMIMATTFLYIKRGHSAYLDICLAAAVNLSLFLFLRVYSREENTWTLARLLPFYIAVTAAFYIKGFVGVMVPVTCVGAFLVWQRDWKAFLRLRPITGILVFIILVLPWHLDLWRQGGAEYFRIFYLDNHVYRFIRTDQSDLGHHAPWYWYLKTIWKFYRPWSLFFIPAAMAFIRKDFRQWLSNDSFKFIVCWFAPAFILLSISSTKREDYLLPLYGALASAIAAWIVFRNDPAKAPIWEQVFIWVFCIGLVAGSVALPIYCSMNSADAGTAPLLFLILLVPLAGLTLYTLVRSPGLFWPASFANTWMLALAGVIFFMPMSMTEYDHSGFSKKVAEITRDAADIYSNSPSETERGFINFYTGRFVTDTTKVGDLNEKAKSGDKVYVIQIYRSSNKLDRKKSEIEAKGVVLDEVLKEEVKPDRYCILWIAKPGEEKP